MAEFNLFAPPPERDGEQGGAPALFDPPPALFERPPSAPEQPSPPAQEQRSSPVPERQERQPSPVPQRPPQRRQRAPRQREPFEGDPLFDQFLRAKYQGGRALVEHPDPVQRRRRRNRQEPRIRFNTGMNYENFRQRIKREFEAWKQERGEDQGQQSRRPRELQVGQRATLENVREGDILHSAFDDSLVQVVSVSPRGMRYQWKREDGSWSRRTRLMSQERLESWAYRLRSRGDQNENQEPQAPRDEGPRARVGERVQSEDRLRVGDVIRSGPNRLPRKILQIKGDRIKTQRLNSFGNPMGEPEAFPITRLRNHKVVTLAGPEGQQPPQRNKDQRGERPHAPIGETIRHPRELRVGDQFTNQHLRTNNQYRVVTNITPEGRVMTRLYHENGEKAEHRDVELTRDMLERYQSYSRRLAEGDEIKSLQDAAIGSYIKHDDTLYKVVHRTDGELHLQKVKEGRPVGRPQKVTSEDLDGGNYKSAKKPSKPEPQGRVSNPKDLYKGAVIKVQHAETPYWARVEKASARSVKVQKVDPETGKEVGSPEQFSAEDLKQWAFLARDPKIPKALRPPLKKPPGGFSAPGSGSLVPNIQPERYRHVKFSVTDGTMDKVRRTIGKLAEGKTDEQVQHMLADLAGAGGIGSRLKSITIRVGAWGEYLEISGSGPEICHMDRKLSFENGEPQGIYNSHFSLRGDAPKGMGLKMFATQVAAASKAGFGKIRVTAAGNGAQRNAVERDGDCPRRYNGYYTWPRFGYDGDFSGWYDRIDYMAEYHEGANQELAIRAREEIKRLVPDAPHNVRFLDVMEAGKAARDWWMEHGKEVELSFDTDPESRSYRYLTEYVRERAKKEMGVGAEEFLNRTASRTKSSLHVLLANKPPKKEAQWENIDPLSDDELETSNGIFDRLREERLKEKSRKTKKASYQILRLVKTHSGCFSQFVDQLRIVRRAKYAPEFLQWARRQRFPSPKTREPIQFDSLPAEEQARIHQLWSHNRQQGQGQGGASSKPTIPEEALRSNTIISNRDPNRYQNVEVEYGALGEDPEEAKRELHQIVGEAAKKQGKTPEQLVTDLAGGGGLAGMLKNVKIVTSGKTVMVSGSGDHIKEMDREVFFDDQGTPVQVHNKLLELSEDAPAGTGTRMLATQIGALKESGGTVITTTGSGCYDCDYKGYYVWPLLGFESKIPENEVEQMPKWLREELLDTGGGEPFYISELMSFSEGREWWLENGNELELEFFVNNDEVLQKYLQRKAKKNNKTVGQFLHNASQRRRGQSKGTSTQVEQAPALTEEDARILGEIWDTVRPAKRKKPMTSKKATSELLKLAKKNSAFRTKLLGEIVKQSDVLDFSIDPFSQRALLRNLRGGDEVEILYEKKEGEPDETEQRLVVSDFDPSIPGVLLGSSGPSQEMLVDRGQGQPLVWVVGPSKKGLEIKQLKTIRSELRLGSKAPGDG